MSADLLYNIAVWAVPVLVAITFHEAAHGFMARRFGDDTAYRLGRLTFNPVKHMSPTGTVLVPGMLLLAQAPFLLGWAKPVPVNPNRLAAPRRDMIWIALAGPCINLVLAVVSAILGHLAVLLPDPATTWAVDMLRRSILINVILAVFNMIPIPPLDGGRVAVGLLPLRLAVPFARLERYGFFILIGVVLVLPLAGRYAGLDLDIFSTIVLEPARFLIGLIMWMTGYF